MVYTKKSNGFSFGGVRASSSTNGRFRSDLQSGTAKNGARYVKSYGITSKGAKWNSVKFDKTVSISKGKNEGKTGRVITTVMKTSRFINPKKN